MATCAGVQPQVVQNQDDGTLALDAISAALFPPSILFAPVRLITLENTIDGKVLPLDYLCNVADFTSERGLKIHIDGARIFNAATALGCDVRDIARYCDTLSFCLSKGLGAPIGSLLVGSAEVIERARRHRQMLGGGLRQAGIIAAAGLYAMQNNVERLKEDHKRAKEIAAALSKIPGLTIEDPQTNMVFCNVDPSIQDRISAFLNEAGIRVSGTAQRQRWVTHLGINDEALAVTMKQFASMPELNHAN